MIFTLRAYLFKTLRSPLFYTAVFGVMALCSTMFLTESFFRGDVVQNVNIFLHIGVYRKALVVFSALPFAANFAEEWDSRVTVHCVSRKGVRKYAAANIFFCFVTAMLTVFLGMMLFCGIYSFFVPFYLPGGNSYSFIFGKFLSNGHGEIFLTLMILVYAVSCAMWAVMGMLLSALIPNKYVAVCSPFAACYVIERISIQLSGLKGDNLWYLSLSAVHCDSDLLGFLYCTGVFVLISVLCGITFCILVQKRVRNESN